MKNSQYYFVIFGTLLLWSCGSDSDDPTDDSDANGTGLATATVNELLETHNTYRSDVGIADLTWDTDLEASAQAWADELATNCEFKHSGGAFGENIWAGTTGAFDPKDVVDSWGSEIANYTYEDNSCADGKVCGHYTQIVWANSTKVGCGTITCDGLDIWVCQYDPPGNFIGQKPY